MIKIPQIKRTSTKTSKKQNVNNKKKKTYSKIWDIIL